MKTQGQTMSLIHQPSAAALVRLPPEISLYRAPAPKLSPAFRISIDWRFVAIAVLVGALGGLGAGLAKSDKAVQAPTATVKSQHLSARLSNVSGSSDRLHAVPASLKPSQEQEVVRLKTRNKRLEALVAVLRQRRHDAKLVATQRVSHSVRR
jgi:hypothetical protein